MSDDLEERFTGYLRGALGRPQLHVTGVRRVFGGFSRHTYIVEVDDGPALVARLDPEVSLLESNRKVEFGLYRAMAGVDDVPVPVAVLDEDDAGPLGRPFFLMQKVPGVASQEQLLVSPHRMQIGAQAVDILGRISVCDWRALGVGDLLDEPADPAASGQVELDKWEQVVDTHQLGPMPVTRAVLRWLRRNPPPPPQRISLVHGDYRTENFLFEDGRVTAVLDWEMAHLGDPVEDLSWWLLDNWRYDREHPELVGAFFPREEFVARWERASGLTVDDTSLRWWTLLSHVKANAIWITAGHRFALGETGDLAMPVIPWVFVNQQEAWMLTELVAAGGAPAGGAA